MGPKRFDEIEALKAQAVAARTYAFAHRGQFEAEGYDLCATPKCQVYAAPSAEDPLSTAAVDATRGLVLAHDGQFADALFVSTCGGVTENVENVFSGGPVPYLVSVDCGELADRGGRGRDRAARETAPVRGRRSSGGATFCAATRRSKAAARAAASRRRRSSRECRSARRRRRG